MTLWGQSHAASQNRCLPPQSEVHLWQIPLTGAWQSAVDILSSDERRRLERYCFERERRRFALARSGLRQILACYTPWPAAALEFTYGAHGKPALAWPLQFNLAHSGDLALCAVGRQALGIDIEQLRPVARLDRLVQRCLSTTEQQVLAQAPTQHREALFFTYWTCKEAYLKATGQGLSVPLDSISIALDAQGAGQVEAEHRWRLRQLSTPLGYRAAIAISPDVQVLRRCPGGEIESG